MEIEDEERDKKKEGKGWTFELNIMMIKFVDEESGNGLRQNDDFFSFFFLISVFCLSVLVLHVRRRLRKKK